MIKAMMARPEYSIKLNVPGDIVETTAPTKGKAPPRGRWTSATRSTSTRARSYNKKGMKVTFKARASTSRSSSRRSEKTPPADNPGAGKKTPGPEAGGLTRPLGHRWSARAPEGRTLRRAPLSVGGERFFSEPRGLWRSYTRLREGLRNALKRFAGGLLLAAAAAGCSQESGELRRPL